MIFDNTTIFDFETTGFSPVDDYIIEVAALRVVKGRTVGTFATTIKPGKKIPAKITELTGITEDDVATQPGIEVVLPYFLHFIGDSVLVAHNAAFDLAFLQTKMMQLGLGDELKNDFIDTRTLCIKHFPFQSHKLEVMCNQLGIKLEGAHRALNDVKATGNLLFKIDKQFKDTKSYVNKLYYFKKYSPPTNVPPHSELVGI